MNRIIGIDVARSLAIFGMILVNFKVVFGSHGPQWLKSITHIFDGKAAATFVVLAGVGLALMTNSAFYNKDIKKRKNNQKRIIHRALFLFILGLSYVVIWPADILHFYGVYILIALYFINKKTKLILYACFGIILCFPLLLVWLNYESGWDFNTLYYKDFWTLNGFIRHLFFNGFHPAIPWTSFMLFGLWYGRQDLKDSRFLKKSFWISIGVFIGIQILSKVLMSISYRLSITELDFIFSTDPMPPLPLYMLNGISIATAVISFCILISKRYANNKVIIALNKTGQLSLTFYVAHVVIGMGGVEIFGHKALGDYSLYFSAIYALIFGAFCIVFAVFWLKHRRMGPLEFLSSASLKLGMK